MKLLVPRSISLFLVGAFGLLSALPGVAQNLSVTGTQTLGPGGASSYANVSVGSNPSGTLNITGTHTLNSSGNFYLGNSATDGVSGTVNQSGGTVNSTGSNFRIAHWDNNVSNYNISSGALNVTPDLNVGWDGTGNLNVSGTGDVNAGTIRVQRNGTLDISAGTVDGTYLDVGTNRQAGNVLQSGGTLNITGGNGIRLAHWGAGTGSTYNMSGGQVNVTGGTFNVGWDGTSTMTTTGTADVNVTGNILVQRASTLAATAGTVTSGSMTIGSGGRGSGTVDVSGTADVDTGTLTIQQGSTLKVSGGDLTTTYLNMGTNNGLGLVEQSGGVVNVTSATGVRVGHWGAGAGSDYDMTGGTLNLTGGGDGLSVGWDGTATMTVSGSSDVNSGTIRVQRNSTLDIQGGTVDGTFLDIGTNRQAGNITQSGGTFTISGDTRLAHWGGGTGSTHGITGGTFNSTGNYYAGWDGTGTFTAGGTADVNFNNLYIQRDSTVTLGGDSVTSVNTLGVGHVRGDNSAPNPTLNIQDNAQLTTNNISIGDRGSRPGDVNQTGGDVTGNGNFKLGHWGSETSTYNISDGTLNLTGTNPGAEQAGTLTIGVDGTGIFNQSGGTVTAEALYMDARGPTGGTDQYNLTGGTLQLRDGGINGNGTTSTYAVNFGGGTVEALQSFTVNTPVNLTGTGGNTTFDTNGNTITVPTVMSGTGGLIKDGDGVLDLTVNQTYTGGTTILDGTVLLSQPANNSTGNIRGVVTVEADGTLQTAAANSLGWAGGSKVDTINLNGGTLDNTASGDQGWGITYNLADGALMQSNGGVSSTTSASRFTPGGGSQINSIASATTNTIAGSIGLREGNPGNLLDFNVEDGAPDTDLLVSAGIRQERPGALGISKSGDGIMVLDGDYQFTGPLMVTGGGLIINGDGSTATGPVTVAAGATLGGSGTVGGTATIDGVLSTGGTANANGLFGIGELTFLDDVAISSGAAFNVELGAGTDNNDRIIAGGTLGIDGSILGGDFLGSFADVAMPGDPFSGSQYWIAESDLLNWTTGFANASLVSLSGLFPTAPTTNSALVDVGGQTFALFYGADRVNNLLIGGNDIVLIAIPEPSRAALLLIALFGMALRRCR